jgi:hypothetical protein
MKTKLYFFAFAVVGLIFFCYLLYTDGYGKDAPTYPLWFYLAAAGASFLSFFASIFLPRQSDNKIKFSSEKFREFKEKGA